MKKYVKNTLISLGVIMLIVIIDLIIESFGISSEGFNHFLLGVFVYLWVGKEKYFQ